MQDHTVGATAGAICEEAKEKIAIAICRRFEDRRGWTQGAWARDGEGNALEIEDSTSTSCCCLGGAIQIASAEVLKSETMLGNDACETMAQECGFAMCEMMAQEYAFAMSDAGWELKLDTVEDRDRQWMGVVVGWNDAKERTVTEVRTMAGTVRERLRRPPPPSPDATPAREIYTSIELRNQRTCERTEPETTTASDWLRNGDSVVCTTTRWDDLSGEILSRQVERIEPEASKTLALKPEQGRA